MVASFYRRVKSDDEYNKIRAKFGDTTSVEAQLAALRSLGLEAEFRKDGNAEMVELEIENGRPVMVAYLSEGNMLLGQPPMCSGLGCGHWAVISGYSQKNSDDPPLDTSRPTRLSRNGKRRLVKSASRPQRQGQASGIQATLGSPEGPSTGWVILVND